MNLLVCLQYRILFASILAVAVLAILPGLFTVHAQSSYYQNHDVDVKINQDSTVDISEKITVYFNDNNLHFVNRDITLENGENVAKCQSDPSFQCGGFSIIGNVQVLDGNDKVVTSGVTQEIIEVGSEKRLSVKWTFAPNGRDFNGELFTYTIKYKVFGSLGRFNDYDLFYWNMLPSDRPADISASKMQIHFPGDINFNSKNLNVLTSSGDTSTYTSSFEKATQTLTINARDIPAGQDFTVLVKFPKNIVAKAATLKLVLSPDTVDLTVNGIDISNFNKTEIVGIPAGNLDLTVSKFGYDSQTIKLQLTDGDAKQISVSLQMTWWMTILITFLVICNVLGCLSLPLFLFLLYRLWSKKGRDVGRSKVIVPEYSPPDGIRPYLLGSLKDEHVDLVDITSTIIDLAYRGYIKIRELSKDDYELNALKPFDDLSKSEKLIATDIFGSSGRVTISDLKYKFYKKISTINDTIYQEMVDKGYFLARPDNVRATSAGLGFVMLFVGAGLFVFNLAIAFTVPIVVTWGASLAVTGLGMIILANAMPAKTALGSSVLDKILGFRMYMFTAERFRVQHLTPETFEKYLSYAIVFGIEKEWAEKFKDIYKTAPSWYEGSGNAFTTLYFVNALGGFNRSMTTTLVSTPASSGSSGGGWSGGGGFSGGFSGGGGGGGGGGWG